jgi:hypothetical protein
MVARHLVSTRAQGVGTTGALGGGSGSDLTGRSVSGFRFAVSGAGAGSESGAEGGRGVTVLSAAALSAVALSEASSLFGVHAPAPRIIVSATNA